MRQPLSSATRWLSMAAKRYDDECVLCEASALIMRQAMIGKDDSSLAQAEQF
jgi:hypothetical protein